jgi:hypothetical protein
MTKSELEKSLKAAGFTGTGRNFVRHSAGRPGRTMMGFTVLATVDTKAKTVTFNRCEYKKPHKIVKIIAYRISYTEAAKRVAGEG